MSIKDIWKKWTKKEEPTPTPPKPKTLEETQVYDDVKVLYKKDNLTMEGWILEKNFTTLSVVYTDPNKKLQQLNIKINRPYNVTFVENNDFRILF